jgi:glycosyltransferase involved in cell wall biosynthesis
LIKECVLLPNKSLVFGNGSIAGVDLVKFQPNKKLSCMIKKELDIPDKSFVFLYLGRLARDKGVLDLAKAFSELNATNAYLIFVGFDEGELSSQISHICSKKIHKLRFIGFTKEPYNYLASANVLCLPSYREGFGTVIIEAAAMGVPTIGSNIYGITDAIENNQTGLLHEVRDILGLKVLMDNALRDPLLLRRLSVAARDLAANKFDANLITNEWVEFYRLNLS